MKSAHKINNLFELLFAIGYLLVMASTVVVVRDSDIFSSVILLIRALIYFVMFIAWPLYSLKELKIIMPALILSPYLFFDGRMIIVDFAILAIVSSKIKYPNRFNHYLVFLAWVSLAFALVIALLADIGFLPTLSFEWDGRTKESFGFSNPNTFYFFIFSSAFVFYIFKKKFGFIFAGILMVILYSRVDSRTYMFGYMILGFMWVLSSIVNQRVFVASLWLWLISTISLGLVSVVYAQEFALLMTQLVGVDVNKLLSNRIDQISDTATTRGYLNWIFGGLKNTEDSLYVGVINGVGGFGFFILLSIVLNRIFRASVSTRVEKLLVLCVFCTIGLVELPLAANYLISIAIVYKIFYDNKTSSRIKNEFKNQLKPR